MSQRATADAVRGKAHGAAQQVMHNTQQRTIVARWRRLRVRHVANAIDAGDDQIGGEVQKEPVLHDAGATLQLAR